jgi:hypothetical protein
MYAAFLGHGIHCRKFWGAHYRFGDPHYWYAPNLEDPNERGYDAIRRVFLNEILKEIPAFQGPVRADTKGRVAGNVDSEVKNGKSARPE